MTRRKYRAKIEILRDVLAAAKQGDKKTRIMGIANLNSSSLNRYLAYCIKHDLLLPRNGGYMVTSRAEQTLGAINVVLSRDSELHLAVEELARLAGNPRHALDGSYEVPSATNHATGDLLSSRRTDDPRAPRAAAGADSRRRR